MEMQARQEMPNLYLSFKASPGEKVRRQARLIKIFHTTNKWREWRLGGTSDQVRSQRAFSINDMVRFHGKGGEGGLIIH